MAPFAGPLDVALTLGIGIVTFAATNMDDLLVLLVFFSDPGFRPGQVVLGQYLGISALIGLSLLGFLAALAFPPQAVGLLGVLPLSLGAAALWRNRPGAPAREDGEEDEAGEALRTARGRLAGLGRPLAVASVTVANGGDNLGLYIPLFASSSPARLTLLIATFLVMTGLWCWLSRQVMVHPVLGRVLSRWLRPALPWVLMGLGAWILLEAGSVPWLLSVW